MIEKRFYSKILTRLDNLKSAAWIAAHPDVRYLNLSPSEHQLQEALIELAEGVHTLIIELNEKYRCDILGTPRIPNRNKGRK